MAVTEELIARVLQLLPDHSTEEALCETDAQKDVPLADIKEALDILVERGKATAHEMHFRDAPPQD